MPSIYLLNALWQKLFGDRYAAQLLVEATINVVAVLLFAELLRLSNVAHRAWAAILFAIAICVAPPVLGYTELYAVPLILAGYVLWRRGAAIAAGVAVALAASFWLPAILAIVPPIACSKLADRGRLIAAFLGTLAIYLTGFLMIYHSDALGVMRSWFAYAGGHNAFGQSGSFHAVTAQLVQGLTESGIAPLALVALLAIRRPRNQEQSFALWWSVTALLGAATSENFFGHYFFPSFAPLIYTIAVFGIRRPNNIVAAAVSLLVLLFAAVEVRRTISAVRDVTADVRTAALLQNRDGWMLAGRLGRGAYMLADDNYDPSLFLAADARIVGRYDIIAPANRYFISKLAPAAQPDERTRLAKTDVLILGDGPRGPLAGPLLRSGRFVEVCDGRDVPWKIFVRQEVAGRFTHCSP